MINAVVKGLDHYQVGLHDRERPTALLTSVIVNSKRDAKKSKAVEWGDFCFYKPRNDGNSAKGENGAAMMELAKKGLLPGWALFCFKEVTANHDENYSPNIAAFVAEDALLLNPVKDGDGYKGLLIARESASQSVREMVNPETGKGVRVVIPLIYTKVIAEEGVTLGITQGAILQEPC